MALKLLLVLLLCSLAEQKNYVDKSYKSDQGEWWQTATFYKIYVKSFQDSDGDGYGDIDGITSRIDYIKDLGVQAIWLSPIFESKNYDDDYDVSDYRNVQEHYGTLEDFEELVEAAHENGLKVILDFVPNHTSRQHEWFANFEKGVEGFEEFYVGANGSEAPNNWRSKYDGSAWQFNRKRQLNYYHLYHVEQPDLNYRNPAVKTAIQETMAFWLTKYSVDGLHMRDVSYLIEDDQLRNETSTDETNESYDGLTHDFTKNQEGSYEIVYEWRSFVDESTKAAEDVKVLFADADTTLEGLDSIVKYYGSGDSLGVHLSSNKHLLSLNEESDANDVANLISEWIKELPATYRLNWMLGDFRTGRTASRTSSSMVDGFNILTGLLPGIQVTYYGEEIGMEDCEVTDSQTCGEYTATNPFQWDDTLHAGFSNGTPWQQVSEKYKDCNVADQEMDEESHLAVYRKMQEIRAEVKSYENFHLSTLGDDETVLQLIRSHLVDKMFDQYEFFFNMDGGEVTVSLGEKWRKSLIGSVELASNSDRKIGENVTFEDGKLYLGAYEAIVLKEQRTNSGTMLKMFGFSYLFVLLVIRL